MMNFLYVALGGAIGACGRYGLSLLIPVTAGHFPWATWCANVIGCALAGVFVACSQYFGFADKWRLLLMVGVLGGFTTFSSFGVETFYFLRTYQWFVAFNYVFMSLLGGLVALFLAFQLTRMILQ